MQDLALEFTKESPPEGINVFFRSLLEQGIVDALLLPQELESGTSVAHTLVVSPTGVRGAAPTAPVSPVNAARLVSSLTFSHPEKRIGVVLRPCEGRALLELVKLNQAHLDPLLIIGIDCPGIFEPRHYRRLVEEGRITPAGWMKQAAEGESLDVGEIKIRRACRICPDLTTPHASLHIGWVGVNGGSFLLQCVDDLAEVLKEKLGLSSCVEPPGRAKLLEELRSRRAAARVEDLAELAGRLKNINDMADLLTTCLRCGNCREACPICFCRQCVFEGETFEHDAQKYLHRAGRKGLIEMPTDTLLFHLTRINHMGMSCVGCGYCESACPSQLPLTALFQYFGRQVQSIFDYVPGRNPEEKLPLSTYREVELEPR